MTPPHTFERYFAAYRTGIIGHGRCFESPFGRKEIIYADWTASGRSFWPIEEYLQKEIMPFLANTHTETTVTGSLMSKAYEEARRIVKQHVNAGSKDVLIFCGSGMTGAVSKLQRILGLRVPERIGEYLKKAALPIDEERKPIVFITHMEHHSNHLTWLETIATVEIIGRGQNGNVDLDNFRSLLKQYRHRKNKIAAITACSNVTGIPTPYHEIARLIHAVGGYCFVDFACSAPYVNMDMHPEEEAAHLDALYFSPHKFLGGPGTPGILIFNRKLYRNAVPDQPGGGTVDYSNPWGGRTYTTDIEQREDGGTPPFLQAIKAAMCIRLKEEMGVDNILSREEELVCTLMDRFSKIKNIEVLEGSYKQRLGVISFIVKGAHYNLIVKILNDRFGIQTRGGCSCAGTYGHILLDVDKKRSHDIEKSIRAGDLTSKPGWVRLSVHPTMTNGEIDFIMDAIEWTAANFQDVINSYTYDPGSNAYAFNKFSEPLETAAWFKPANWRING